MKTVERTRIIAHRGASLYAPENTMAAFRLAHQQGADAIEFDVKLTRDRKVVILHDATLDRTTNGTGSLNKFTYAQLAHLDASHGKHGFNGERIPLLDDVLEEYGGKLLMNIELTNYASPFDGLVEEVSMILKKHKMPRNAAILSSFSVLNMALAKRFAPQFQFGYLFSTGNFIDQTVIKVFSPAFIHPFSMHTNQCLVDKAHKNGQRVHVWTVNDPVEMVRLSSIGVDAIFTDDPITAKSAFI